MSVVKTLFSDAEPNAEKHLHCAATIPCEDSTVEYFWSAMRDLGHPSTCGNDITACNELSFPNYRSVC